ncbi:extracellular solute-binding protein [Cohnella endophytica]|uniref:Extracellular solute-binding protein n=1 Tax=Cohnella endophytica TaxID=2419778 RepID=A0A494XZ42_9BACL|nr:extracellular solute-binding protein [Cohnella endophytica]RKP54339.1 extracellular solute-binding protein [Cohnella endophytica]
MKKLIRSGFVAISLIALSASITACDPSNSIEEKSGKPIPISVFAQEDAAYDWKTNDFSRLVEDKFGVSFEWKAVPYEGAKEKRQISLASGNYPDTYLLTSYIDQFSQADVIRYGKQGIFYPLNDLIDRYAPHIKEAFDKEPGLKALNTAPDGNIYGLAAFSDCFHCSYPNKLWLNSKWLKKLNLSMPETTEQLRTVLRAFKNGDPNGNGIADEIPLSGSTEDFGVRVLPYLMNGFVYDDDRTYLNVKDGQVSLAADKQEWKEGLAYVKSLYDEGLIDPGAFTQNADAFRQLGENAGAEILGAGTAMHPDIFVDTGPDNRRGSDYDPAPPLHGPHASYAVFYESGTTPGAKFVITDKASPEARIALIRIVDYLYTPIGQANAEVGKEGVDWRKPVAGEKALGPDSVAEFTRIPVKVGEPPRNSGWGGMGHFYMPKTYRDSWVQDMNIYSPDGYERRLYQATKLYEGHEPKELYPMWLVWLDPTNADEASMLQANVKNEIDQSALQFITGEKNLDKDWDDYIQRLKSLGTDRYVSIMQQAYDAWARENELMK